MKPDHLDPERCDRCLLCEEICGRGFFTIREWTTVYRPTDDCIACGHCMAVCPGEALRNEAGAAPPPVTPSLLPTADEVLHLFRARRSTRRFKKELPPRERLERLVEAARHAPTGTNTQQVRIAMVTDEEKIDTLRTRIMARYADYERHLSNPVKRWFLKTFVDRRLGEAKIRAYLKNFLERYRAGKDPLFHEAPVLVFLHTGPGASTPKDDCCLAIHQMTLLGERLGLGSCLLGTAEAAFARTRDLNDLLRIPRESTVHAAACFGIPRIPFLRLAERRPPAVQWFEAGK